jgi:hypothetical protein
MVTRTFKCPEDLWAEAAECAEQRGDMLSTVLRDALRKYLRKCRRELAEAARLEAAATAAAATSAPKRRKTG